MGGTQRQQGNPCSQLIRGGNGHRSQGNCFVFLSSRGAGGGRWWCLSKGQRAAGFQHGHAHGHAHGLQPSVPGCAGLCAPGNSSPLGSGLGWCSPHPSFSTRGPSQRRCHTHQSRREKGDLPFGQTIRRDRLPPIPSSPANLSLPLRGGDLATLLELSHRCPCEAQAPLRVCPGNKGHILSLVVWSRLRRGPVTRSGEH